jgi:hypothetical protein
MDDTPKVCSECGSEHPVHRVMCDCGEALADGHYLRWVVGTLVVAVAIEAAAGQLDPTRAFVRNVFVTESALMLMLYPLSKAVQKGQDPRRPVLAEMGSVMGAGHMRAAILAMVAAVIWLGATQGVQSLVPAVPTPGAPPLAWFDFARSWVLRPLAVVALAAVVADQRLALLQPWTPNPYLAREADRA